VHYVRSQTSAEEVAARIRDTGGEARVFEGDVADADTCQALVKEVIAEFGGLDVLVNNAGITRDTLALRMREEDWRAVIDTNLSSAFFLAKAALRGMLRQNHGRIINISSVGGLIGNVGQANYVAAKAGIIGLTKALAREYAARGVTVNAVAPGPVDTPLLQFDQLTDEQKELELQNPLGRIGRPEEVAHVVSFLAGERSSFITGQCISVDAGAAMH